MTDPSFRQEDMVFRPLNENTNRDGWIWDDYNQDWIPATVQDPDAFQHSFDPKVIQQRAQQLAQQQKKERREREKRERQQVKSVYITGLPPEFEEKDLVQFLQKAGILKKDPITLQPMLKIYRNSDGTIKGDALATYFKPESIALATQVLDGMEFTIGFPLSVTEAVFKGEGPKKKKKGPKKSKEQVQNARRLNQERDLSWNDDENRVHVVLKHMFDPAEAQGDPSFYKDLKEEIQDEASKLGPIEKLVLFERNVDGVVIIKYKWPQSAEACIDRMNGRFFGGQKIEAHYYDGVSNYFVEESEEEKQKRIEQFGEWLSDDDDEEQEALPPRPNQTRKQPKKDEADD